MIPTLFAVTETEASTGLFQALGIDVQLLIVQIISFLILFLILKKFVYPVFTRALDDRQQKIEESVKAAERASKDAEKSEERSEELLQKAKEDAAGIVALAHTEAAKIVDEAEKKAEKRADHLLEQAQARIDSEIVTARRALQSEMALLVTSATEKVIAQKLDAKGDALLVKKALEESR